MTNISRRGWMATAATAAAMALSDRSTIGGGAASAIPAIQPHENATSVLAFARNVLEFGARGDAKTDNTAAFQKALDAAYSVGGGIVHVPAGKYLFKGHLAMPSNTALVGVFAGPPGGFFGQIGAGTVLLPTEGRGKSDGPAFISILGVNCTVRGLGIYYPEQLGDAAAPTPYPWTIQNIGQLPAGDQPLGGDGSSGLSVIDVNISNAYQGIDLTLARRHYIARVYGRPILTGIYVDQCYDVSRIENVHFVWPFWSCGNAIAEWIQNHGTAFRFGRTDWQCVFNTFSFQYHIGYHFIQTPSGTCYGNFSGISADSAQYSIVVDAAEDFNGGLHITNGGFSSFTGSDPQGIIIGPKNKGQVCLTNCGFWGPSTSRIGTIQGKGPVSLIGCSFNNWNAKRGEPEILCDGASVTVNGCLFMCHGKRRVIGITKRCRGAVITNNTCHGEAFVVVRPGPLPLTKFQIHSNIAVSSNVAD